MHAFQSFEFPVLLMLSITIYNVVLGKGLRDKLHNISHYSVIGDAVRTVL
jgi:hypothetical protein